MGSNNEKTKDRFAVLNDLVKEYQNECQDALNDLREVQEFISKVQPLARMTDEEVAGAVEHLKDAEDFYIELSAFLARYMLSTGWTG